jgi:ABC-type sugar transport system ATPase subunit
VTNRDVHVELRGVSKRYGGVQALRDVDLRIDRGSIHGLVGENGAGKSTLSKVIAGAVQPDTGDLIVDGRSTQYRSPRDALADGVTIVAQELALLPQRSVIENVYLGIENRRLGFVIDAETGWLSGFPRMSAWGHCELQSSKRSRSFELSPVTPS